MGWLHPDAGPRGYAFYRKVVAILQPSQFLLNTVHLYSNNPTHWLPILACIRPDGPIFLRQIGASKVDLYMHIPDVQEIHKQHQDHLFVRPR